jgi:dienelactone hydrolase
MLKATGWLIAAGATGVILLLASAYVDNRRATSLPLPTGPYAVGRSMREWRDPQHVDALAPSPGTTRELVAWIWYPARPAAAGSDHAAYLPGAWSEAPGTGFFSHLVNRNPARIRTHSTVDAAVSDTRADYPVLLLRAGLAAQTLSYSSLAEDLASHGYVVVGIDAPFRTGFVAMTDGRILRRTPQNDAERVDGAALTALATRLMQAWVEDLRFTLDALAQINTADSRRQFTGRLDLQRVGVLGHSLGGATALQFCHDDARCRAGADIDGLALGSVVRDGVTQPFLFIQSDHGGEDIPDTRRILADLQSIHDRLPADRRGWIEIAGANHYNFSDGAVLKSPVLMRALRLAGVIGISGAEQLDITRRLLIAFFDAQLRAGQLSLVRPMRLVPSV